MEANERWRSVYRQAEYNRLRKKTREHEFVERLEREFEFSPRESRGVLEVVVLRFRAYRTERGRKLRGVLSTFASSFLLEENEQWLRTQMQKA